VTLILSLVEQYQEQLSGIFQALADPTRRAVLGRLGRGPASISELATPFNMALPSFMKHIEKKQFAAVEAWLSDQRALWEGRADRLEQFVTSAEKKEKSK
jgi:DNA-binding transcriptional ArsR family regulator